MRNDRGNIPVVFIMALVVLAVGMAGIFLFSNKASTGHAKPNTEKPSEVTIPLDEFVVNLADTREPRYLKVEIVLEVRGSGAKEEVSHEKAKVRDCIIQILSSKHYKDLLASAGKEQLKAELKNALNEVLESSKIVEVYFTSFAMQ